jgi:parallel beta-helix repeat protein
MNRCLLRSVAVFPLFFAVSISPVTATTWHVPGDAPTIKGGIAVASAGDTVLVACGTYNENNIRMKSGVVLLSATGQADCVTIDAQRLNRVIYCRAVDSSTRIEGFTITGGFVDVGGDEDNGAGVYCLNGSALSIVNCNITGNFAGYDGGGVCCLTNSSPTFINCTVTNNEAVNGGSGMRFSEGASPTLIDCDISNNLGTGIWISVSSPELIRCTVSDNSSSGISHSAFNMPASHSTFTDCTISGNSGREGGGIRLWGVAATFTDCQILNNDADWGGGVWCLASSVSLITCAIEGNSANTGGGACLDNYNQTNTSLLSSYKTTFSNNTAGTGPTGFVEADSKMILQCSVENLVGFAGGGTIILDNEECLVAVENTTWGRLKALYR